MQGERRQAEQHDAAGEPGAGGECDRVRCCLCRVTAESSDGGAAVMPVGCRRGRDPVASRLPVAASDTEGLACVADGKPLVAHGTLRSWLQVSCAATVSRVATVVSRSSRELARSVSSHRSCSGGRGHQNGDDHQSRRRWPGVPWPNAQVAVRGQELKPAIRGKELRGLTFREAFTLPP